MTVFIVVVFTLMLIVVFFTLMLIMTFFSMPLCKGIISSSDEVIN